MLANLTAAGVGADEIGERMGRTAYSVENRRRKTLHAHPGSLTFRYADVARATGRSIRQVQRCKAARRIGRYLDKTQFDHLVAVLRAA